jgi:putative membrane protein
MFKKSGPAIIVAISIIVPIVVVILMYLPERYNFLGVEAGMFPLLHAVLNGMTALLLVTGYVLIKNRKVELVGSGITKGDAIPDANARAHRYVMTTAFILSAVFLVSYVISKISNEPVPYPEDAPLRGLYLFILVTHIVLSGIILPLVLYTMYFAWNRKFAKHKKIARWTFPIWLYIAITGVLVYVFMRPYY